MLCRILVIACCCCILQSSASTSNPKRPCNALSEFKCGSGECIPKYNVCNELSNCKDGSDEEFCLDLGQRSAAGEELGVTSIIAEFRSAFRTFVREIMKEISSLLRLKKSMGDGVEIVECKSEDAFFCKADSICVPLSARCDTKHDCSDGEDERPGLCSIVDGSSLRRSTNKKPILMEDRAEALVPLPDIRELEKTRRWQFSPRGKVSSTTTETVKVICNSKQFACDSTCIPLSWVCDDLEDCMDKTDERQEKCRKSTKTNS